MGCKEKLESYLREKQVAFQLHHHPPAYTAQAVAQSEHVSGRIVAKVVMAFADGKLVLLALPAHERVDLGKVAATAGVKEARLAHEKEFADRFPDCEVGAMPPFGNLYDLPTYVDSDLAEDETIIFQAGTHQDTVHMRYIDFEKLVHPVVADFACRGYAVTA